MIARPAGEATASSMRVSLPPLHLAQTQLSALDEERVSKAVTAAARQIAGQLDTRVNGSAPRYSARVRQ